MLSCKDVTEKASDYLDHKLPLRTRLGMRLHLFMCVRCRQYLHQLHTTVRTLSLLGERRQASEQEIESTLETLRHKDKQQP